jgi:hypothetical protein
VSTEFRQHGIPYIFVTSVYSVCYTELLKIPRNYTEFRVTECSRIPRNSVRFLHGISQDSLITYWSSLKAVKGTLTWDFRHLICFYQVTPAGSLIHGLRPF